MSKELRFPRVNNIILTGRLTRDPELRYTTQGTPIAQLPIAFDRRYQRDGEWISDTSFVDVIVWGARGEKCVSYLKKGSAVLIEGYLQTRSYLNKENQKVKVAEIVGHKVSFLEWGDDNQNVEDDPDDGIDTKDKDVPF
jgi:single-strand DNA-binding protein